MGRPGPTTPTSFAFYMRIIQKTTPENVLNAQVARFLSLPTNAEKARFEDFLGFRRIPPCGCTSGQHRIFTQRVKTNMAAEIQKKTALTGLKVTTQYKALRTCLVRCGTVGKALVFWSRDWSSTPSTGVNFSSSIFPVIILIKHANIKKMNLVAPGVTKRKQGN